jgi:hypothetical protein
MKLIIAYIMTLNMACFLEYSLALGKSSNELDTTLVTEIKEEVLKISGFCLLANIADIRQNIDIKRISLTDSARTKLSGYYDCDNIWEVDFDRIILHDSTTDNQGVVKPVDFRAIYDSKNRLLLKIESILSDKEPIDLSLIEQIIQNAKKPIQGKFIGFASSLPAHSFIEVLKADDRKYPFEFSKLEAVYATLALSHDIQKKYWILNIIKPEEGGEFTIYDPYGNRELNRKHTTSVIVIDDKTNATKAVSIGAINIDK